MNKKFYREAAAAILPALAIGLITLFAAILAAQSGTPETTGEQLKAAGLMWLYVFIMLPILALVNDYITKLY